MTDFPTPNLSSDLTGHAVLITGTTSGLGRRFAIVPPAGSAKVALTGRRADRLDELAAKIRASGGICEPIPFDITQSEQITEVLDKAEATLGMVDMLVNSAGIPGAQRAPKMSDDLVDRVFSTNLTGPRKLSCEVARRHIINLNAIAPGAFSSGMMDGMFERLGDITSHFPRKRLDDGQGSR